MALGKKETPPLRAEGAPGEQEELMGRQRQGRALKRRDWGTHGFLVMVSLEQGVFS